MKVTTIQEEHLPEVGQFLHENLNQRFSAERWISSLTHPWSAERPNLGMQLRDGDRLVGVFCAIYSDQVIDGKVERFCNPHSWCVLETHRRQGIGFALVGVGVAAAVTGVVLAVTGGSDDDASADGDSGVTAWVDRGTAGVVGWGTF